MKNAKLKITLLYNFAVPAILLNSVGIFILNLTKYYGITAQAAGWLEPFKDFSILIASFLLVSSIPRLGYRKSLFIGVLLEALACLLMAAHPTFMMARLFFILVGVSFALIKVSSYSSVGLMTKNDQEHASFLTFLEGFFMVGILAGFWVFAFFMEHSDKGWVGTFWFLFGLSIIGLILILISPMDESRMTKLNENESFWGGYKKMSLLMTELVVWAFLLFALGYLFIEQGVFNFLPLFNQDILHLTSASSIEMASLLSAGIALGRIVFGFVMKYIHWSKVIFFCLIAASLILLYALYLASSIHFSDSDKLISSWSQFPLAAYLLPLVGFLVAPVYPTLNSSILSCQKLENHSAMTVLIMIFSAIGGTLGSVIVGEVFGLFGGLIAFGVFTIPLFLLLIFIFPYAGMLKSKHLMEKRIV